MDRQKPSADTRPPDDNLTCEFKRLIAEQIGRATDAVTEEEIREYADSLATQSEDFLPYSCIHSLFEQQVRRTPDAVAVIFNGKPMTYGELNGKSNQLAHHLLNRGVGPEALVGICMEQSPELIVGLLGILKAGGAYVPLDPGFPAKYLSTILENTRPAVLLTQQRLAENLPASGADLLCLDSDWSGIADESDENPAIESTPESLAYVLYLSGKGVMVEHRGIQNRLDFLKEELSLSESDVVLHKSPLALDMSVWEIFWPLTCGGSLVIAGTEAQSDPHYIRRIIAEQGVSVAHFLPSALTDFVESCGRNTRGESSLRLVLCSGEPLRRSVVEGFFQSFESDLYYLFGYPEAATEITLHDCKSEKFKDGVVFYQPTSLPVYILDDLLQPVPIGVPGEIYIAGESLARGYLNDEVETERAFLDDPFGELPGDKMFRTGDVGLRLEDGSVELLSKAERGVWVKGFRVELGEIEAALLAEPSVEDCAVLARETDDGQRELVAYVVSAESFSPNRFRSHLAALLPPTLVPDAYVAISNIPLTPNGKVDEKTLSRLGVLDSEIIERCENRFRSAAQSDHIAVAVRDQNERIPSLHLSDLFPDWKRVSLQHDNEPGASVPPQAEPESEPKPNNLAISHGEPLREEAGRPATLQDALRRAAGQASDHGIIYVQPDGSETFQSYGALLQEAERILTGLRRLGVGPHDKVIFQFDRNEDFIPAFWGCALAGVVPVPIGVAPSYEQSNSTTNKLRNAWEMLEKPLVLSSAKLAPQVQSLSGLLDLDDFRVEAIDEMRELDPDHDWHVSRPDDVAIMLLTSGSTGMPKGVAQSHRSILTRSASTSQMNDFSAADISLNWFPLDHVGGIVMFHIRDLFLGCRQLQVPTQLILQHPLKWLDLIDRHRATITWAPNFAYGLINANAEAIGERAWDLSSMRFILNAGEAIVARTVRRFMSLLAPCGLPPTAMRPAWGMSETSSAVTFSDNFSLDSTTDHDSFVEVGAPIPGFSVRIVDANDQLVAEDTIGRLQVKGPTVTSGYYRNEELNQEVFTNDGWFNTGDLGVLRRGRLTITGRQKDVIIINGVNFYSHEIEAVVEEVEGVEVSFTAACATREPGSDTDQLIVFFSPAASDDDTLLSLLKDIREKIVRDIGVNPAHLIPVEKKVIPKTEIGKIQRAQLRQRFEAGEFDGLLKNIDVLSGNAYTLPNWFHKKVWRHREIRTSTVRPARGRYLVFLDDAGLGDHLCARLDEFDTEYVSVKAGPEFNRTGLTSYRINPGDPEHYKRLVKSLSDDEIRITRILHLWTYGDTVTRVSNPERLELAQIQGTYSLTFLAQALADARAFESPIQLQVVSRSSRSILPTDEIAFAHSSVLGLIKTISGEMPWVQCRHVDLPEDEFETNANRILRETQAAKRESDVAYRNGQRLVLRLEAADLRQQRAREVPFKHGGMYLLSGGLGGLGVEIARYLLKNYQAKLLLVGRTALPDRGDWDDHLESRDEFSHKISALQSLEGIGGEVVYEAIDITDLGRLRQVTEEAKGRWQCELDGVIQLAGVFRERPLMEESRESMAAVLSAKLLGTCALHQLIKDTAGGLFITFSSVSGFFGGTGTGAYAAANSFLYSFSEYQNTKTALRSYCFAWSMWDDVGMSRDYEKKDATRARGYHIIPLEQGLTSMLVGLRYDHRQLLIGLDGSNLRIRQHLESDFHQAQRLSAFFLPDLDHESLAKLKQLTVQDRFQSPVNCDFIKIEEIPVDESGEVDRKRLSEMARLSRGGSDTRIAPRTETEIQLAEIWQEVLGISTPGIYDNFFELGGHSILATQVVSRINEAFNIELPLRSLFESPTIAALSQQIRSRCSPVDGAELPPIEAVSREGKLPLSFAQQRLWFLDQLEPGSIFYNVPVAVRLKGKLDKHALARSLNRVIARHETLRTAFIKEGGEAVQVIAPQLAIDIEEVELKEAGEQARREEAAHRARRIARQGFDLARGPLIRASLIEVSRDEAVLVVVLHHIVSDGWSMGVLISEMKQHYEWEVRGIQEEMEELKVQYADYAVWQREWMSGDVFDEQMGYWKEKLAGIEPMELGSERARGVERRGEGARQEVRMSREVVEGMKELGRREAATLYMVMLAGMSVLMSRYSGKSDVAIGTPIANRRRTEVEGLIGFFVNTLVMRNEVKGGDSASEMIRRVRESSLEAYGHQDIPFERLVEELQPERALSHNPIFQIMFILQNAPMPPLELPGLTLSPFEIETGTTPFDLTVSLWERGEGITGCFEYSTDLFDADTIARMVSHFGVILKSAVANPDQPISSLPMFTEAELDQIIVEWNKTDKDFPQDKCIHEMFESQAERTPDAGALVFKGQRLTYNELNARANNLAHYLRELGVGPEVMVGICVERGVDMIVAVLGVLKAGGAYVPLDPNYPKERLSFMLEDAGLSVLLTHAELQGRLEGGRARRVCLDLDRNAIAEQSSEPLVNQSEPSNLIYVVYTSGSTGRPKGVAMIHRSLANLIAWHMRQSRFAGGARTLQFASFSFDVSFEEIFSTLCSGGTLVIISEQLRRDPQSLLRLLVAEDVEKLFLPFIALQQLAEAAEAAEEVPAHLREVITSGEQLQVTKPIANFFDRLGDCTLENEYGPSESHLATRFKLAGLAREWPALPSIGGPIHNAKVYILDKHLQPVPVGVPGELYIGGVSLARCYYNWPEMTAEKFIPDSFGPRSGGRLYKTGDLARYRSDEKLEFLGRVDQQVKVRGFRVEIGEIELALRQHDGLRDAAVILLEPQPSRKQLVAYVVAEPGGNLTAGEMRSFLKTKLPDYMIPSAFISLNELPLTPNGKLDRRMLPLPDRSKIEFGKDYVAPRTPTEELLAAIWADVLKLDQVSVNDNFFEVGGHSLLITQLTWRLQEAFQLDIPVRQLFECSTIAEQASAIESRIKDGGGLPATPIPAVARTEELPLSFAQQRLWFLDNISPSGSMYNIPVAVRLKGRLDAEALKSSFDEIVRRHETLRTNFATVDGQPMQVISAEASMRLTTINLSRLPAPERRASALRLALEEAQKPFELAQGPLVRATLLRLAEDEHLLVVIMHHIISDGWSMSVFIREMTILYDAFSNDRPSPLPALPIQYADYAHWQRQSLKANVLEEQLEYWKHQLGGQLPVLQLPTDRPRPAAQTYNGSTTSLRLTEQLTADLKALLRRNGVTLFMTLMAAFQTLLYRYSDQPDILVGTPITNRNREETENLIGFFISTLVIRSDLSGDPTFRRLLLRVREVALGAYAHQDLPFERIVEELQPERSLSYTPIFQVWFVLQAPIARDAQLPTVSLSPFDLQNNTAKYDLTLSLEETGPDLVAVMEYNTDLFDAPTVERMIDQFSVLLEAATANPDEQISGLPLLREAEREQLLANRKQGGNTYDKRRLVHEIFEAQANRFANNEAVTLGDQKLTYEELNASANQLAHHLQAMNVGPEVRVAVCMDRTVEMVVSLLGILKAGGAYVPLDPAYPKERLAFILEDSQSSLLLTQQHLLERLPANDTLVVCIDSEWEFIALQSAENPATTADPENLAYVIYTSGSTGNPKGVLVTHSNVARLFDATRSWFHFDENDVWTFFHSSAFDFSVWEIWGALLHGGRLVVVPFMVSRSSELFYDLLCSEGVTVLNQTPSAFRQLIYADQSSYRSSDLNLRLVIFGGEALDIQSLSVWFDAHGDDRPRLVNMYGITETTVHVTYRPLKASDLSQSWRSLIGGPIPDLQVFILDQRLAPLPVGIPGEIYVGGDGLARGYLSRPDLTAERFIPNPYGDTPGARLYKTGDLARLLTDGDVEYLGRADLQVKIRGFRIELGEIEAAIASHPDVRETVVIVRDDAQGDKRLVAYAVADQQQALDSSELRSMLKERLPEYMVPSAIVMLDALPRTANGKLDRRALPAPDGLRPELDEEFMVARTPTEAMLSSIWTGVLGVDRIGVRDNFFELGGHSLLAALLISRVRDTFSIELPLRSLYEGPTLTEQAALVDQALEEQQCLSGPILRRVSRDENLPLSFAQQRLWFLAQLEPTSTLYNVPTAIRLKGVLSADALAKSLNELVRRHEILRTSFSIADGQPVQVISPGLVINLPIVDLRTVAEGKAMAAAMAIVADEAGRNFDLSECPLFRSRLLRLDEQDHILLVVMHHIVSDAWSMDIFVRELSMLYASFRTGVENQLPDLPIQYADFAHWQRELLQGEVLDEQLQYWKEHLRGAPEVLALPIDRPRPPVQSFRGEIQPIVMSLGLAARIKELSHHEGVTLFMTFLAACNTLLYRYANQQDVVVGTPIANRNRREIEGLIGFFVNTLVIRTDLSGGPSFRQLLKRQKEVALGAFAHQDLPFEKLVESLQPERDLSRTPLFQVMFVIQTGDVEHFKLPGLELSLLNIESHKAKFDLILFVADTPEGIRGGIEYNSDLFERPTIERMVRHYEVLLEDILADPDKPVSRLTLLTPQERDQLLIEWNRTDKDYPAGVLVHELFERQAERTPHSIALTHEGERLTYLELNNRANQLAHYLRSMRVRPETRVGICVERSVEMIVGLLGILKSGGAYVPLDPAYPPQRLAFMLEDAQINVLLTQERMLQILPEHSATVVRLDADWDGIALYDERNPQSHVVSDNLAYVIYTSGSTGTPKGVAITHGSCAAFLHWAQETFPEEQLAGTLASTSICFDLSVFEIFTPLSLGGKIILAENALHLTTLPDAGEITLINTVPSAMAELVKKGSIPASAQTVNLAGEALAMSLAQSIYEQETVERVYNLYGPSEDTTYSVFTMIEKGGQGATPIGRPIANTQAYILDQEMAPTPIGVHGELLLGGMGLARCYLNRPELTADKFIPDPFGKQPGARLYRTGDLARYPASGRMEFLGRIDDQVKIRGFRIEPGEIETALRQHPAIAEALVMVKEYAPGDKRIVAYLVPEGKRAGESALIADLRRLLKDRLPDFMVPSAFVMMDAFPLTPNGKVDRRALPAPETGRPDLKAAYSAPQTDAEQSVAAIWQELLQVEKVGIYDNFFELGGTSLLIVQAHSRLREALNTDVTVIDLFKFPTINSLTQHLTHKQGEQSSFERSRDRAAKKRGVIEQRRNAMKRGGQ